MSDSQGPAISKPPRTPAATPRWLVGLAVAAGLFAYRPLLTFSTTEALSQQAEDWFFMPSETAPLLVLTLGAWLLYRRRDRWLALSPDSGHPVAGMCLLVTGTLVFGWAMPTGATNLLPVSLALMLLGTAALLRGRPGLRVVGLPAAFLLFAVPLPGPLLNAVVYQFQIWTADWAGWLLYQMGSSAFVTGELILKPEETFAIIEGCSGMKSVETLTMLSVLLVDLFHRRGLHAVLLVAVAPAVAFLMNGLRVLTLIFNPHSEIVAIHNLQGVSILLGGLFLLALLDSGFSRVLPQPDVPSPQGEPPRSTRTAGLGWSTNPARLAAAAWGFCALLSLSLPHWAEPAPAASGLRARFSEPLGDWDASTLEIDRSFLGSVWFRESIHRRFRSGAGVVDLFLAVGDRRHRGVSLLSPKTAIPESGARVLETGRSVLEPGHQAIEWSLMRSDTRRILVYHWYFATGGLARESVQAALGLQASPFRIAGEALVVRLSTDVQGPGKTGVSRARERLEEFYGDLQPRLDSLRRTLARNQFSQISIRWKISSISGQPAES